MFYAKRVNPLLTTVFIDEQESLETKISKFNLEEQSLLI